MKILIVDDHIDNLTILGDIIENSGFEYELATDGVEAINALNKGMFNVVIMDINMPHIDGFEAIEYIRNNFPDPMNKIPVIAMTAIKKRHGLFEFEFENAGFSCIIEKPFSIDTLLEAIEVYAIKDEVLQLNKIQLKRNLEFNEFLKNKNKY